MQPTPIPMKMLERGIPLVFTPPTGQEDQVGDLQILVVEDFASVLMGKKADVPRWYSWWQPSDLELEKLAKGAPIRLVIWGATAINPMSIEVGAGLGEEDN